MIPSRHFHALVDLVDEDGPAFSALVTVTDATVAIHAFDITIGEWAIDHISVVQSDDGVLIEVPGSLLCVRTDDDDALAGCLVDGLAAQAGAA